MNNYLPKIFLFLLLFQGINMSLFPQDPYNIDQYEFINYDANKLVFPGDSESFSKLFLAFNNLILKGDGQINVVHIGDSHIQADNFSGRMRQRLQTFFQGGIGGRGFVFPYTVAKTNNPPSYKVSYTGKWDHCRLVDNKSCKLGLSGISVSTTDTVASISIKLKVNDGPQYTFNKIKIFHNTDSTCLTVGIDNYKEKRIMEYDDCLGYTMFILDNYIDSVNLKFRKTNNFQKEFILHGISLETYDPGVIYHSIGVNGAMVSSYLKCELFREHLKALTPDMLIISLGANDTYTKGFDSIWFQHNLDSLLRMIKSVSPDVSIILTVPSDSYLFRKKLNQHIPFARNVIFRMAQKFNCAVWDFYKIMGGAKSIDLWLKSNLANKDRLHLVKKGYYLQGDLLFSAFLKSYDSFIDKTQVK